MLALTLSAAAARASADGMPGSKANDPVAFDIPAQPLAPALDRYGDATGREVLYDTVLAEGRRSGAVRGVFTPEAALQHLLDGTGLSARFLADGSFVLLPAAQVLQLPVAVTSSALQQRYYARIQASLRDALCAGERTRPGRYRLAALFWIGPSGSVQRYARLGSAGSADLDRGIDERLQGLDIGGPPPAGFVQPVLIMIRPQAPGVTMGCDPAGGLIEARP